MTFPNLQNEKMIVLDSKTVDPKLTELGSGVRRGGRILGIGLGVKDKQWYFPLTHDPINNDDLFEDLPKLENVNQDHFFEYLRSLRHIPFVFANAMYVLDYTQYFYFIPDVCHDIQIAEPLIDENQDHY